jgi:methionine-rich copper-binding protein CopC
LTALPSVGRLIDQPVNGDGMGLKSSSALDRSTQIRQHWPMRQPTTTLRRVASGVSAFVLAAAVAVLAAATPAAAHGTLAMSTPAEDATVGEPLSVVELYFTEKVASNAYFTITAPDGGRVDNGWASGSPKPLDKPVREYVLVEGKFEPREYTTGFPAVVTVAHLPSAGQYSVSYLSVASDGDPVRGTLTFRYNGRPTPAPQGWSPPTIQPDPALLAAAERHGTPGQAPPSSVASAPTEPSAAAAPAQPKDDGGTGWVTWTGWAVAVAAVVAGLALWRGGGRFAAAKRRSGRSRGRVPESRRGRASGPSARAKPATGSRAKKPTPAGRGATVTATQEGGAVVTVQAQASTVNGTATADPEAKDAASAPVTVGQGLSNTRLALLVGGLVVALLAGFGLGRLGGDERASGGSTATISGGPAASGGPQATGNGHQHAPGTGPHTHPGDAAAALATGTTVSAGGYTLKPARREQPAGQSVDYTFHIVGTDRRPATRFAVVHDKPLHMIVVSRDLSGYQHLHPTMAPDGTWTVPLKLTRPGTYRIYADFTVTGTDGTTQLPLVLGVDHVVPGAHTPVALPPVRPHATAGAFMVSIEGTPTVGVTAPMFFRVSRNGAPVPAQLERYLGAYGHLVVVREGDLGYVHVHPEPQLVDGAVKFWLTVPSAGRYRAYFDFQIASEVHTAEYTLDTA